MSEPGYGSWNWTPININVWHYLLTKANNQKYFLNTPLGLNMVNELQKVSEEKDIVVVLDSSLKVELHAAEKIKRQIEWLV